MLSQMAKDFFAESPLLAYPLVAMVLFMTVFLAITWRTMRRDPHDYDALAQLPLTDAPPDESEAAEVTEP